MRFSRLILPLLFLVILFSCQETSEKSKSLTVKNAKTIDVKANSQADYAVEGMVCQMGCGGSIRKALKATCALAFLPGCYTGRGLMSQSGLVVGSTWRYWSGTKKGHINTGVRAVLALHGVSSPATALGSMLVAVGVVAAPPLWRLMPQGGDIAGHTYST